MFDYEIEQEEQAELDRALAEENAAVAELGKPAGDDMPDVPQKKQLEFVYIK